MEQILMNVKEALRGTPRPHYLVGEAVILLEGNTIKATGTASFPLSDPSIADRRDHVNVTATLFALWNLSHLMGRQVGRDHFRITELISHYYKSFLPEKIISLEVSILVKKVSLRLQEKLIRELVPEEKRKTVDLFIHGNLQATFTLGEEKVAKVEAKFVGWKQN